MDKERTYPTSIRLTEEAEKKIRKRFDSLTDFCNYCINNFLFDEESLIKEIELSEKNTERLKSLLAEAQKKEENIKENLPPIECLWFEIAKSRIDKKPNCLYGNLKSYSNIFHKSISDAEFKKLINIGSEKAKNLSTNERIKLSEELVRLTSNPDNE